MSVGKLHYKVSVSKKIHLFWVLFVFIKTRMDLMRGISDSGLARDYFLFCLTINHYIWNFWACCNMSQIAVFILNR